MSLQGFRKCVMQKWILPSGLVQSSWDCPLYIWSGHRLCFPNKTVLLSLKIVFRLDFRICPPRSVFALAISADLDEVPHYAAFHLDLHCLPKYAFRVTSIQWVHACSALLTDAL